MKITRKGYYRAIRPDGSFLSQHTSRDECYEAITEDGTGTYRIKCPDREVDVALILQPPEAPPGYADFVPNWTQMAKASADNFAAGGNDWEADEYKENGPRTVFYSAYDNLLQHTEWAIRTGNTVDDLSAGRSKALQVQLSRWGVGPSSAWHRAADAVYHAVQRGEATEQDIIGHVEGNFSFSRLNEYKMGSAEDTTHQYHGRYTSRSRPAALLAKALVYYEMQGLGRYKDPQQGNETIPFVYEMMINHLYRWRNEFLNQDTPNKSDDDTAPFMIALTIDAIRVCREWFIENGENPEQFFPAQVLNGEYGSTSFITNTWTDSIAACEDVLNWLVADGLDTDPYPKSSEYCRVTRTHTANDGGGPGSGGDRLLGDPMVQNNVAYYRSTNAYKADNIQMMNVINYWWLASITNDNKMIEYGDNLFYGAVLRYKDSFKQKTKNQNMYSIYEAFKYRNIVTGRND